MISREEQYEMDIAANAADRLQLWLKDTAMRCEIVDMPAGRQMAVIASVLIHKLISLWTLMDVPPPDAGRIVHDLYKDYLDEDAKARSQQKPKVK